MNIAKNHHPVKSSINIENHPAYLCFSPRTALAMCPPSSCPAGMRFIDVISSPTHPANAIGLRDSV